MNQELIAWVWRFYGKDLPVYYGQQKNSKPYVVDSGYVLFVGVNWLKKHAEEDLELKRLLVMEEL